MNTKYLLRTMLGQSPALLPIFPLLSEEIRTKGLAFSSHTDIVVEGFPRSANSFFCWYFRTANPNIKMAHHLHIPSNILAATRRSLPAITLLRDPEQAIVSLMVGFSGKVRLNHLMMNYHNFYNRIEAVLSDCIISEFKTTVAHPDKVIAAVNTKYGTSFQTQLPNDITHDDFSEHARVAEAKRTGTASNTQLLTTPDERKEVEKIKFKDMVKNHPKMPSLRAQYQALCLHPSTVIV